MNAASDVVIVGAGAAGLMCAATAGARGRRVTLVDHRATIGERIRVSGGGRCNVTNLQMSADHFLSDNPHFCRSALARFTPAHMLALLDGSGITWDEREQGQVFGRESAVGIVRMLVDACDAVHTSWWKPCTVDAVARPQGDGSGFLLSTSRGPLTCEALVVATGGLAAPQLGASSWGIDCARQFGLPVTPPAPALVPLTFEGDDLAFFKALAGVSFRGTVFGPEDGPASTFTGDILITHDGLSGPAILQVSSYWQAARREWPAPTIRLDLMPDEDALGWLKAARTSRSTLVTLLSARLPRRFVEALAQRYQWPVVLAEVSNSRLESIAAQLSSWTLHPSGTRGFKKAEVMLGGVSTTALSSRSMEAIQVPGLYFIGEVVDVTGHLGGYNLHWAWASGWAAGQCA